MDASGIFQRVTCSGQHIRHLPGKSEFAEPIQAHVVRGILSPEGDSQ